MSKRRRKSRKIRRRSDAEIYRNGFDYPAPSRYKLSKRRYYGDRDNDRVYARKSRRIKKPQRVTGVIRDSLEKWKPVTPIINPLPSRHCVKKNRRAFFGFLAVRGHAGKGNKKHGNRFKNCGGK